MRTRTHEVVRMLAMFKRSAHCRRLRDAAAAQEARALLNEDHAPGDEDEENPDAEFCGPCKPHTGMH